MVTRWKSCTVWYKGLEPLVDCGIRGGGGGAGTHPPWVLKDGRVHTYAHTS